MHDVRFVGPVYRTILLFVIHCKSKRLSFPSDVTKMKSKRTLHGVEKFCNASLSFRFMLCRCIIINKMRAHRWIKGYLPSNISYTENEQFTYSTKRRGNEKPFKICLYNNKNDVRQRTHPNYLNVVAKYCSMAQAKFQ